MSEDNFSVKFWGVRGSVPVAGAEFVRYGGNTACVEMRCGRHVLMFDAGSGLKPAGKALRAEGIADLDLFFTHCHYDHILGLPFFAPLYEVRSRVILWSGHLSGTMTTEEMFRNYMRPPFFPVEPDICRAKTPCRDFHPGDILQPREGVVVKTGRLAHPNGCTGYRVEFGGRAVALISDTEHQPGRMDEMVLSLIRDCDLVIYDATYTDEEMKTYAGFGHSSWQQGVRLCRAARVKQLALFHHDPARDDKALAAIEKKAKREFPGAFAARDGQTVAVSVDVEAHAMAMS